MKISMSELLNLRAKTGSEPGISIFPSVCGFHLTWINADYIIIETMNAPFSQL